MDQHPLLPDKVDKRGSAMQDLGTPRYPLTYMKIDDGGLSAAQRVRLEPSNYSDSRAHSSSRSNSSEVDFATDSSLNDKIDEKKNGPKSCPTKLQDTRVVKSNYTYGSRRPLRSGEAVVSKLLPTRDTVSSLMKYLHELQISEASMRRQLVTTKRHTEKDLYQSLSKLNELQKAMQMVERDRQTAQQKLEEKEMRIRELAAKLEKAEATQEAKIRPSDSGTFVNDDSDIVTNEVALPKKDESSVEHICTLERAKEPDLTAAISQSAIQSPPFELMSPHSPKQPLWDPWASGGATPMKDLPPVFTMGGTGLQAQTTSVSVVTKNLGLRQAENYELKSVLASPHEPSDEAIESLLLSPCAKEHNTIAEVAREQAASNLLDSQVPASNVGSTPLTEKRRPHDLLRTISEKSSQQVRQESSSRKFPSFSKPMLYVGAMPPIYESPYEQPVVCLTAHSDELEMHNPHTQQITQPPSSSTQKARPKYGETVILPSNNDEHSATLVPPIAVFEKNALKVSRPSLKSAQIAQDPHPARKLYIGTEKSLNAVPSTALPIQKDSKIDSAEPHLLEAWLINFFTKVDKERLKMAAVYLKRYAGREKWLFAELTKRYGAIEVDAMKAQYEKGMNDATTSSSGGYTRKFKVATDAVASKKQSNSGFQGQPQYQQLSRSPNSDSNLNFGDASSAFKENNALKCQLGQEAIKTRAPSDSSGKDAMYHKKTIMQRCSPSKGRNFPVTGPPASLQSPQKSSDSKIAAEVCSSSLLMMNESTFVQYDEPIQGLNQPSIPPHTDEQTNNVAPLGLHQRHNTSKPSALYQKGEPSNVTLESMLRDLYRKHQPDKLKNAITVAKQYVGKERELVKLLKGKYGALSVKRLEENLELLERVHDANRRRKHVGKNRIFFVLTISLGFWLLSLSVMIVNFVVLDAWECHRVGRDMQPAKECALFNKELEAFTYDRVADYMSQTYPNACFCSEWNARKSGLHSNFSRYELVNMAKLVPFSPNSFKVPWIASVKGLAISQVFNASAKSVVDQLLSAGLFLWSTVLDFADFSKTKAYPVEDNIAHTLLLEEERNRDAYTLKQVADEMESTSKVDAIDYLLLEKDTATALFNAGDIKGELGAEQLTAVIDASKEAPEANGLPSKGHGDESDNPLNEALQESPLFSHSAVEMDAIEDHLILEGPSSAPYEDYKPTMDLSGDVFQEVKPVVGSLITKAFESNSNAAKEVTAMADGDNDVAIENVVPDLVLKLAFGSEFCNANSSNLNSIGSYDDDRGDKKRFVALTEYKSKNTSAQFDEQLEAHVSQIDDAKTAMPIEAEVSIFKVELRNEVTDLIQINTGVAAVPSEREPIKVDEVKGSIFSSESQAASFNAVCFEEDLKHCSAGLNMFSTTKAQNSKTKASVLLEKSEVTEALKASDTAGTNCGGRNEDLTMEAEGAKHINMCSIENADAIAADEIESNITFKNEDLHVDNEVEFESVIEVMTEPAQTTKRELEGNQKVLINEFSELADDVESKKEGKISHKVIDETHQSANHKTSTSNVDMSECVKEHGADEISERDIETDKSYSSERNFDVIRAAAFEENDVEAEFLKLGDEDEAEDEDITYMEELEHPDEVLRMAEQAAAADIVAMETRW
ncbi:hypothetical protein CCR75_009547 [Bremia lactucae]|uniref:Uncharacterized protein n=1 Tax=Bremia lactucae TaxID=4779 RepID=A0A976NZ72_BRELC|nr:hypothetical protein CCR75_009547 [Bremia lactucae]